MSRGDPVSTRKQQLASQRCVTLPSVGGGGAGRRHGVRGSVARTRGSDASAPDRSALRRAVTHALAEGTQLLPHDVPPPHLGPRRAGGGTPAAAVSGLGLLVVDHVVPTEVRRAHNDTACYVSNSAAFVYAVLLAFLAVGVWEDYGKAQLTVQGPRGRRGQRRVPRRAGVPRGLSVPRAEGIRAYVDIVLGEEWALQARDRMTDVGWRAIEALHRTMLDFEPRGPREQIVHTEALRHMHTLIDQRRLRILMGAAGLPPVVCGR